MTSTEPSIYAYSNYREYLAKYLSEHQKRGESIRALCRRCGISSPNYLQQVLRGHRNLTKHFATKFALGAQLNSLETEFLISLIDLDATEGERDRQRILKSMRRIVKRAERRTIYDQGLHSSWVNQVLWEVAKTVWFSEDIGNLRALLRNSATKEELEKSFGYLRQRGFLASPGKGMTLEPVPVDFQPSNDVRRIDLQLCHTRFLQLAQHRLNDPLTDREYQGLTAAIKKEEFEAIRKRCRDFIAELNRDFAVDRDGDDVIRIQLSVFKLIQPTD